MIEVDAPARTGHVDAGRRAGPGTAVLAVGCAAGRSVVRRAFATSPVRLLTPANHGRAAWVYVSGYGGGLVDGDRTDTTIDIGAGAAAFVSTQASTKIYRSPRGTGSTLRARVAAGGLLVLAPDPVACFAGSTYRQVQQVELEGDAALVLVDWMSSGRHAAGERWAFDEYSSRLTVRVDGQLALYEALALRAADIDLASQLGRFNVLAVVVLAGPSIAGAAASAVAGLARRPAARQPELLAAGAAVGDGLWVLRVAGRSAEQVGRTIRALLAFVPGLLGDDPWTRKW